MVFFYFEVNWFLFFWWLGVDQLVRNRTWARPSIEEKKNWSQQVSNLWLVRQNDKGLPLGRGLVLLSCYHFFYLLNWMFRPKKQAHQHCTAQLTSITTIIPLTLTHSSFVPHTPKLQPPEAFLHLLASISSADKVSPSKSTLFSIKFIKKLACYII